MIRDGFRIWWCMEDLVVYGCLVFFGDFLWPPNLGTFKGFGASCKYVMIYIYIYIWFMFCEDLWRFIVFRRSYISKWVSLYIMIHIYIYVCVSFFVFFICFSQFWSLILRSSRFFNGTLPSIVDFYIHLDRSWPSCFQVFFPHFLLVSVQWCNHYHGWLQSKLGPLWFFIVFCGSW